MRKTEDKLVQLKHFFKQYKQVSGLYFKIHFSDYHYKKIVLNLADSFNKTKLFEPIFSINCDNKISNPANFAKICLFNIETLCELIEDKEFDEETMIICPVCNKISKAMDFYYEESLVQIINKINSFTNNLKEEIYQISIKSNFHWKTKNHIYLKGVIKLDKEKTGNNNKEDNDIGFFDNFMEIENESKLETFPLYEDLYEKVKDDNELSDHFEKVKEIESVNQMKKNDFKYFYFIKENTNILIVCRFAESKVQFHSHLLLYKNRSFSSISLMFYKNYTFLYTKSKELFIFNDAGAILKCDESIDLEIPNEKILNFYKFHCFDLRFYSPKLQFINQSIYVLGGCTQDDVCLRTCYKITNIRDSKENLKSKISDMINVRKDFFSVLFEKEEKIYIFGGSIYQGDKIIIKNELFDVYNIKNECWNEILLKFTEFPIFSSIKINNTHELNDDEIIIFGKEFNLNVNLIKNSIEEVPLKVNNIDHIIETLKISLNITKEEVDEIIINDKNLLCYKYNFL